MKRMQTKMILSAVLAIAMLSSTVFPALAAENQYNISGLVEGNVSVLTQMEMSEDIQKLENFGLSRDDLIRIGTVNGSHYYSYNFKDEIVSTVSIDEASNGDIYLTNVEGDKKDIVLITSGGELYLNGLQVETVCAYRDSAVPLVTPRYTMYWKTETCPYGSPSDYTDYQYTSSVFSVEFQQYIEDLTVAAIIEVLKYAIPAYGEIVDMLAQVVDHIADDDITPNTAASFRERYYYHSTKGYYVSNSYGTKLGVAKVVMEWYTNEFYSGDPREFIYYDCGSLS